MILSNVWRWFPGWVRVEAEGGYPERLLNDLTQFNRPVWNVRHRQESVFFSCLAGDYALLRHPSRKACVRIRIRKKHGLPFVLHRYRRHKGLIVALALYVAVLAVLGGRIWVIQVVGNTETPETSIRAVTEKMGVQIGKKVSSLDIKNVEIAGLDCLPSLSWITANPSGCVVRIEVTERSPKPSVLDLSTPSDIIALRDGRIVSMDVLSGQKAVLVGEAVKAGTVLISGCVTGALGDRWYRAYGEVWAETKRLLTVSVPLSYWKTTSTGRVMVYPTVTFLNQRFALHPTLTPDETYYHTKKDRFLTVKGIALPLGITHDFYWETQKKKSARTEQQAENLAERLLREKEKAVFDGMFFEEVSRENAVQNGSLILKVTYRCRENIAVEVPRSLT